MDDDIDKSQWIPNGEPILAGKFDPKTKDFIPYRKDLKIEYRDNGEVHFAQHQVHNILNFLWNREVISDQNHHDGQTFEIWRNMHRVQIGTAKACSSGEGEIMGERLRAYGFVLLLKRLRLSDCQAIEAAIDMFSYEHTQWMAWQYRRSYAGAFDRLSIALEPIHQQVRYLEKLTDEERDALANENLKNFLANIKKQC